MRNPDWHRAWVTGSGQVVYNVHDEAKCAGRPCTVHNPSDHHMRGWPTLLRGNEPGDLAVFTERICPHGVGHPDPDDPHVESIHGCDGCCTDEGKNTSECRNEWCSNGTDDEQCAECHDSEAEANE